MMTFLQTFSKSILGQLSGFDRLIFRGMFRNLSYVEGMQSYLWRNKVLLKDFGRFCEAQSAMVKKAGEETATRYQRPVHYLASSGMSKEEMAKAIVKKDKLESGLITLLTAVEPCRSFDIFKNRQTHKLELVKRNRKCLFHYYYLLHPVFGFCHVRIQTWFPFELQIYVNGREWLARSMDKHDLTYVRRDNCFTDIANLNKAQRLFDRQLETDWPSVLGKMVTAANPGLRSVLGPGFSDPYWCVHQSEWASDVMFTSKQALDDIYPDFVVHGLKTMNSPDVMRFLCGKNLHGNFEGQIVSDVKRRVEGVRIKHRAGQNSIKAYNKQGSVLRVETTINDPKPFKVFRLKENAGKGDKPEWLPLRKGVADLKRRSEVSQAANDRYLDHLAQTSQEASVDEMIRAISKSVRLDGRSYRGLNVGASEDDKLLAAIGDGAYTINGFRNRDISQALFGGSAKSKDEAKRRSAKISRLLKILRAHGLIKKVPKSHRYHLTDKGKLIVTLLGQLKNLSVNKLMTLAA